MSDVIFLVFLVSVFFVFSGTLTVHKCCPFGYRLLKNFTCEPFLSGSPNGTAGINSSSVTNSSKAAISSGTTTVTTPLDGITNSTSSSIETSDDLSWFPKLALYNDSDLMEKLTGSEQEKVINWLNKKGTVQYGMSFFSECQRLEFQFSVFNDTRPTFRILVKDESHVDVLTTLSESIETDVKFGDTFKLPVHDVCFDLSYNSGRNVVVFCPHRSSSKPWVRKCCPLGKFLNAEIQKCIPFPPGLKIRDWKPHNRTGELKNYFLRFLVKKPFPSCPTQSSLDLFREVVHEHRCKGFYNPNFEISFLADGSVQTKRGVFRPDQYCGERTWHPAAGYIEHNLIYCRQSSTNNDPRSLYGALFIIGGFCLLATVIISLLVPELRQRIHNKIAITHNATLMTAHFIWGATLLSPTNKLPIFLCQTLCVLIQFTFLGSLFWLNAMCINMSSTFRTTRNLSGRSVRSDSRRYLIYSVYAWGLTAIISIITLSVELSETTPFGLPRPGFTCFCDFARKTFSVFVYFYGPMAVLLFSNTVLYTFTVWKIMTVSKQVTGELQKKDSKTTGGSIQTDRQRLILYTKLFLIMGLSWTTEIIGWVVDPEQNAQMFWVFMDVINLLRAVFIFIIFICQRSVLRNIRGHLQQATGRLRWSGSTVATDAISLSTVGPSRKHSQYDEGVGRRNRSGSDVTDHILASRQFKENLEEKLCAKYVGVVKEAEETEDDELRCG